MPLPLPHKLSPTWPSPRVRDSSPKIVTSVALLHAVVAGWLNFTHGGDEDAIGRWLLTPAASAGAATVVWALFAIRIEAGAPGWKRLPGVMFVDPDSLPQRRLRWHWLLWFTPLTLLVSAVALALAPTTGYSEPSTGDLVFGVVATIVAQAFGALVGALLPGLTILPVALVVVGCTRMTDGRRMGLPPTGPLLVSTGLMLLAIAPMAFSIAMAGTRAQAGDPSVLWASIALVSTLVLFASAFFLAGYAIYARLRDKTTPSDSELWPHA